MVLQRSYLAAVQLAVEHPYLVHGTIEEVCGSRLLAVAYEEVGNAFAYVGASFRIDRPVYICPGICPIVN